MKKILLTLSLAISVLGFGQYSQDGYGNSYGWYDTYDEGYFPDDYYYNYPSDYYSDDYYQSMYNDYRNSIVSINWNRFFVEARLSPYQINLIIALNRQFPSFSIWNSSYRSNPLRWYYDRFYALRQILGPQVFVVFQNDFYHGYSPVVYYTNYWRDYYRPRFSCRPRYRNVNIDLYRVNRYDFHRGNNFGWNQPNNPHNPGISGNGGGRVGAPNSNMSPGRNSGIQNRPFSSTRNDGFRNGNLGNISNSVREFPGSARTERSNSGNIPRNQSGFRIGTAPEMRNRTESVPRGSQPRSSDRKESGNSRSSRNSEMRFTSR